MCKQPCLRFICYPALLIGLLLLAACAAPGAAPAVTTTDETETTQGTATNAAAPTANLTDSCVDNYSPDVDYFPDKVELTHTDGFRVAYHNNYKVVTVDTPWPGAESAFEYVLVQCGTPAPEGYDPIQVVEVPVQSIATMSTSYLPFLDNLALLDKLVAVDDVTYVNNPTVVAMVEAGELAQIGYGAGVNIEQLLDLDPDIIMTYGSGAPEYDAHPVLLNAGLHTVVNAEWLETSPLGRAEWGKFIALFFNKEGLAEAQFAEIAQRYADLAAQAAAVEEKPTVFTDSEYQGTWYVAGGNSFTAQYIEDAGADYLWADDTSTGSIPLAFEVIYDRAAEADYWINVGFLNSLAELEAADTRYTDFAAFQNANVWNNNKQQNANGGYGYYESAVAHPDVVLADLISIFHPDLLPAHETVYYQQLP